MDGFDCNDFVFGDAGNDSLDSVEGVVNNDNLNGCIGSDICDSDPDPEEDCEL